MKERITTWALALLCIVSFAWATEQIIEGDIHLYGADPSIVLDGSTASDTDWWIGVDADEGGDDNDSLKAGTGLTKGSNVKFTLDKDGNLTLAGTVSGTGANTVNGVFTVNPDATNEVFQVNDGSIDLADGNAGTTGTLTVDASGHLSYNKNFAATDIDGIIGSNTPAAITGTTIATSGANNMTIANGNLVIGTSGNGIDFSATSDAAGMTSELLDDYEEGTFGSADANGILYPHTSGSITCGTTYVGYYTKVGNQVTATVYAAVSAVSSPVGVLRVVLPLVSVDQAIGPIKTYNIPYSGDSIYARVPASQSYGQVETNATNAGGSTIDASTIVSTDYIILSITYFTS